MRRAFALLSAGSTHTHTQRVMVTGAMGQIGTELIGAMRHRYGAENVLATDVREPGAGHFGKAGDGPFERLDITDSAAFAALAADFGATTLVHNVSVLSGTGEKDPDLALRVNVRGTEAAVEIGRSTPGLKLFIPSSIAAFGPSTPQDNVPNEVITRPSTIYGVSKVYTELMGECVLAAARCSFTTADVCL